ncbi:MAG: amidoligase family protein, partial [Lachnospiraceae bacterium]|nr:amidoligase family protein [Lachnospiraceae bacterium]
QGREWKFQRDVSISGPDSEKTELVTPILRYEDIETLQELCRRLRKAGAKSDATRGCGVHIHIGANGHTPQSLRNLANIMASHESLLADALRLDRGRMNRYCRTVDPDFLRLLNQRKPKTMAALADVWYRGNGADYGRSQHYNDSRYHMLNLHPGLAWSLGSRDHAKPTIEFRLFQFSEPANGKQNGIHAGEMKSYIQLCLAMSELAKEVAYASPKPQQTENEAYAMRCWMLRLGFIGDEFKTAREILLRNMEGNCAWRSAC